MSDIKIFIAAHKPYELPKDDIYYPIHVGAEGKAAIAGLTPDNTGENISAKNPNFCELTGLYWLWKNESYDVMGLCHYRRYFAHGLGLDRRSRIDGRTQVEKALSKAPIVLPKKRNYVIETNYSQYVHAHHEEDLKVTREILQERYPSYVAAYDEYMKKSSGHRFNMFIMTREYGDAYCKWLFDVLFELERRLDISSYSAYDARVFGFVSERLLDVWIMANGYKYTEVPYVNLESQHWGKKIIGFLGRKFGNGRK